MQLLGFLSTIVNYWCCSRTLKVKERLALNVFVRVPTMSLLHHEHPRHLRPNKYCYSRIQYIMCSLQTTVAVQRTIAGLVSFCGGAKAFHVEPVVGHSWSNPLNKEQPSLA